MLLFLVCLLVCIYHELWSFCVPVGVYLPRLCVVVVFFVCLFFCKTSAVNIVSDCFVKAVCFSIVCSVICLFC